MGRASAPTSQGNDLSGEIPASWGAGAISAVLQHMDLSTNAVEGTLPDSWSGMQNLAKLRLAENKLQVQYFHSWAGDISETRIKACIQG